MNINIKDVITLDNNIKYVVVSKINYDNKICYYIVDTNNNQNMKFCYEENDSLIEINDNKLIVNLLPLFYKETINSLKDEKL